MNRRSRTSGEMLLQDGPFGTRRTRRVLAGETMADLPIRWIEARAFCHATEDEPKVARALDTACPGGDPERRALEGHFGNPLVLLVRRVEYRKAIREVWGRWMKAGVIASIAPDVDDRVDEDGILHFRIDKQTAYLGSLALAREGDTIDVRLKLMAFPAKAEQARRVARSLLSGGA